MAKVWCESKEATMIVDWTLHFPSDLFVTTGNKMTKMTPKDYQDQISLLDRRINKLISPVPSRQILQIAEAIGSAELSDEDSPGIYCEDDYANLLEAQGVVNELLAPILQGIRANSISPSKGWRFESVNAGYGDYGLCANCRDPFQHFNETVKVHCLHMHPNAYHGVCRECVRQYAPLEFVETDGVEDWLRLNRAACERVESDSKTEDQRVDLIDAIRSHAHSTHYFSDIVRNAPKWAEGAFGEWR